MGKAIRDAIIAELKRQDVYMKDMSEKEVVIDGCVDLERLTAALSEQPAVAVPDGWKLVPEHVTDAMSEAAWASDGTDYVGEHHRIARFDLAYGAALAAAPQPAPQPVVVKSVVGLDPYDAGLLNDWGGGNIEWWQDYIRNELERAHEYYVAQITTPPADLREENERLRAWGLDIQKGYTAAEARVKALEADAGILLAQLDAFQEATGERLEAEDAAIVEAIRAALKGGD